jgi:hypothetical protein
MFPKKAIFVASLFLAAVMLLIHCSNKAKEAEPAQETRFPLFSAEDVSKGKIVAARYCQSCHQLPDPSLLNKKIWADYILPLMGQDLGIPSPPRLHTPQIDKKYVPVKPLISPLEWKQINAYYITNAPAHMPTLNRAEPLHQLPFFEIKPTPAKWTSTQALTSYVKIDTSVSPHRIIVNDGLNNELIILNDKLEMLNSVTLNSTIVNLLFQKNKIMATAIGPNLEANDFKNGSISAIGIDNKGAVTTKGKSLFVGLNRPLSVDLADFNGDGKQDYLITQFGKMSGALSWFEKSADKEKDHVLRNVPGCLKTIVTYDHNAKRPDIWALFGQGDEGIFLYTNKGKGIFKERRVLSFPPTYGSICFDLVDFNGDGFKDIIYACGDNADYSQILKPYHGVYIYLNDGKDNFNQKYFYPIHGCNKFIARDFDGDGDLDIATISEAPGFKTPWEAFIYLENKGAFNFQTYTLPLNANFKRGMTMDAADIDGDGKADLLLGSGFVADAANSQDKHPLFMVLKNITSGKDKKNLKFIARGQ